MDHSKLTVSRQWAFAAKKVGSILGCIRKGIASSLREVILPLWSALVRTHLKCSDQLWAPQNKGDLDTLEQVQQRALKMAEGQEHLAYTEKRRERGLFNLNKRRLGEILPTCINT